MLYLILFGLVYTFQMVHMTIVEMVFTNIFRRNMEISLYVSTGDLVHCLQCLRFQLDQELSRYNLFVSFVTRENMPERNMLHIVIRRIREN